MCWGWPLQLSRHLAATRDQPSRVAAMEGVVLRIEQTDRVVVRAKVVRPDFVQSIEKHWTTNEREPNRRATSG